MATRTPTIVHVDTANFAHYKSSDLDYFEDILNELLRNLSDAESPLARPEQAAETKVRAAVALFKCANHGERDRSRLKHEMLAALRTGAQEPRLV